MSAPITPSDCARRCEALIVRLVDEKERDLWRAYAAKRIEYVLRERAAVERWLRDLEWYLRLRAEGDAAIARFV